MHRSKYRIQQNGNPNEDVATESGTALRASVLRRAIRSSKAAQERGEEMETFEQTGIAAA